MSVNSLQHQQHIRTNTKHHSKPRTSSFRKFRRHTQQLQTLLPASCYQRMYSAEGFAAYIFCVATTAADVTGLALCYTTANVSSATTTYISFRVNDRKAS